MSYPKDWETVELNKKYKRVSGTPITAEMMANIACAGGNIAVYAGGNTKIKAKSDCIQNSNIINDEVVIVQSRGIIDFIFSDKPCTFKNEFWGYIGDKNNSVKFLYYLLKNNVTYFRTAGEGRSSFSQITKSVTENYSIPNIKITEQQAIVDALTAFDTHINNLAKLIEKKKMIRDGAVEDLVSGKRRLAGFSGKWEEISFNDSVIPKARIGWQGLKKDEYLQSGYSYLISGTDFYRGTISFEEISYVSKDRYDMDSNIQVKSGDVLVTKDGTIGKVAIVPNIDKRATLNSGVFVFRVIEKIKRKFLYWILRSSLFSNFIDELSAGSTIKHLYQKDLKQLKFVIPTSLSEQQAIADILTSMDKEISDLEEEKEKYIALKAGAMDDLLTGKIRLV